MNKTRIHILFLSLFVIQLNPYTYICILNSKKIE